MSQHTTYLNTVLELKHIVSALKFFSSPQQIRDTKQLKPDFKTKSLLIFDLPILSGTLLFFGFF